MVEPLNIFSALGDATRLRILALLRRMELSVGELAQVLGQSQPRVSRHVKILCDAGLAERRKEGSWVFVVLGEPAVVDPIAAALDGWTAGQADHWAVADAARLAAVRADRAASAASWFEGHAGEWDAIRSLHIAETEVEAAIAAMLGLRDEAGPSLGVLIDIGTGTGRMLELFAGRANSALGIDRSSEMLRLARVKLAGAGNTDLRQADLYALPMADGEANVAIIHHVLHFAQQPGAAIAEAARVLGPGGRLLIADFAPHDREELRTRAAHVRLGFADEQVAGWAEAAGLKMVRIETLVGGQLTVKLWLARKPAAALHEVKAA